MGPEGRRLEQGAEEDARRRCSRAWSLSRQKGLGLLQALGRREGAYDCCSEGCRQEAEGAAEVNIGEGKFHWLSHTCQLMLHVGSKAPKKTAKKAPAKRASA